MNDPPLFRVTPVLRAAGARRSGTVNCVLGFDESTSNGRAFDPADSQLEGIPTEAAARWSHIVEDIYTTSIQFYHGSCPTAAPGVITSDASGNRALSGNIIFSDSRDWYFDPLPTTDTEFICTQTLYQDTVASDFTISTTAEPLLDVGYCSSAEGTDPNAALGLDILITAMHETGHLMGLTL